MFGRKRENALLARDAHPGPGTKSQRNTFMNAKESNFAYKVRHALNENIDLLPTTTTERLASARKFALSRKKKYSPLRARVPQATLAGRFGNFFDEPFSWLTR